MPQRLHRLDISRYIADYMGYVETDRTLSGLVQFPGPSSPLIIQSTELCYITSHKLRAFELLKLTASLHTKQCPLHNDMYLINAYVPKGRPCNNQTHQTFRYDFG